MIVNILVIVFIGLMAYWWGTQGLLSALLHLLLTLMAGALALAVWEPLTVNLLLARMPETAWGVGLLAPFALILLGLRIAFDRLVPGNVDMHSLANSLAGGALGLAAGILATGLLVIGMLFLGPLKMDYEPYRLDAAGNPERVQRLWVPVDDIAGRLFSGLADGALHPTLGRGLTWYHPDLAREAGLFRLGASPGARRAMRAGAVEPVTYLQAASAPADKINVAGDEKLLIVSSTVNDRAYDRNRVFTATAAQVALLVENSDQTQTVLPIGYLQNRTFGGLGAGDFARSKVGASSASFQWLFILPNDADPLALRLKQLRLDMPAEPAAPTGQADALLAAVDWSGTVTSTDDQRPPDQRPGSPEGLPSGVEGVAVEVSARLPFTISINDLRMRNGDAENGMLTRASARIARPNRRVGSGNSVDQIYHDPSSSAVVQVELHPDRARSMFGQALEVAAMNTQAPVLVDAGGNRYRSVGYIEATDGQMEININTSQPMRSLAEIDLGRLQNNERLILYFLVGHNTHLVSFQIGNASSQELDLWVP